MAEPVEHGDVPGGPEGGEFLGLGEGDLRCAVEQGTDALVSCEIEVGDAAGLPAQGELGDVEEGSEVLQVNEIVAEQG